jgi:hypothetical protein
MRYLHGKLIAVENVRLGGVWREVEVYVNSSALAWNMAEKASKSKSQQSSARFGTIKVKVRPL